MDYKPSKINYLKIGLEFLVIFSSIFISFYIEDVRKVNENFLIKNELITDLISTVEDDLNQLKNVQDILQNSEKIIQEILNDIDNSHSQLNDIEAINKILEIEVGISFFSKDGIFNQLISTGTFELVKNEELKKNLLDIFNHQKDRNTATSNEIDSFNLIFRNEINKNFRIRFSYNSFDGEFYGTRTLTNSNFNEKYYFSNSFYGLISQSQQYVNMYMRQLKDIEENYKTIYALSKEEVKKDI
tara:strand:+ start:237 stop:965 length:729 start_codon:yes stop_codon:yes gene_type:complete